MLFKKLDKYYILLRTPNGFKESSLYTLEGEVYCRISSHSYSRILQNNLTSVSSITWSKLYYHEFDDSFSEIVPTYTQGRVELHDLPHTAPISRPVNTGNVDYGVLDADDAFREERDEDERYGE